MKIKNTKCDRSDQFGVEILDVRVYSMQESRII